MYNQNNRDFTNPAIRQSANIFLNDKYALTDKILGRGAFGTVYRGYSRQDPNQLFAIKQVKYTDHPDVRRLVKREVNLIVLAQSQHIVQYPNSQIRLFDVISTQYHTYLVFEFCEGGDLRKFLKRRGTLLPEELVILFLNHIIRGYKFAFDRKIIHRDLKPENILLSQGKAKISDFGLARMLEDNDDKPCTYTIGGTFEYMSPQVFDRQKYSSKCDIWSLGIMAYEMLYGQVPIKLNSFEYEKNHREGIRLEFPQKPFRSDSIKQLLIRMLQMREEDRISWDELFRTKISLQQIFSVDRSVKTVRPDTEMQRVIEDSIINNNIRTVEKRRVVESDITEEDEQNQDKCEVTQLQEQSSAKGLNQLGSQNEAVPPEQNIQKIVNSHDLMLQNNQLILELNNYILIQRNIAVFINLTYGQFYQQFKNKQILVQPIQFYEVSYVLLHHQISFFIMIQRHFHDSDNQIVDSAWKLYRASDVCQGTKKMVEDDLGVIVKYFEQLKKTILSKQQNPNEQVSEQLLNQIKSSSNDTSILLSIMTLHVDFIVHCNLLQHKIQKLKKETLVLLNYLILCVQPIKSFEVLNSKYFDFYQFYDKFENQLAEYELVLTLQQNRIQMKNENHSGLNLVQQK